MKNIKTISAYVKTLEAYKSYEENLAILEVLDAKRYRTKQKDLTEDAVYNARCEIVEAIMDKFDVDMVEAGYLTNDAIYAIRQGLVEELAEPAEPAVEEKETVETSEAVEASDIGMTVEEVEEKLSRRYGIEFDGIDAEDGKPDFEDVEDFLYQLEEICPDKKGYLTLPLNGHEYRVWDVTVDDEDRTAFLSMEKVA